LKLQIFITRRGADEKALRGASAAKIGNQQRVTKLTMGTQQRLPMSKFLIGVAMAALWFALSHAADAEQICRQVCENGTCVSKCVDYSDSDVIIRDHDELAGSRSRA
jgi:hypothetical protein